jgi:hypothetical protein
MSELLRNCYPELLLGLAVLALASVGAVYFARSFRDRADEGEAGSSKLMSKFREMHSRGDLDEAEYRTIKTVLAAQLEEELSDTGERG